MILEHDAFFYQGSEARLFRAGSEIPNGWKDHPSVLGDETTPVISHDGNMPGANMTDTEIRAELAKKGVQAHHRLGRDKLLMLLEQANGV